MDLQLGDYRLWSYQANTAGGPCSYQQMTDYAVNAGDLNAATRPGDTTFDTLVDPSGVMDFGDPIWLYDEATETYERAEMTAVAGGPVFTVTVRHPLKYAYDPATTAFWSSTPPLDDLLAARIVTTAPSIQAVKIIFFVSNTEPDALWDEAAMIAAGGIPLLTMGGSVITGLGDTGIVGAPSIGGRQLATQRHPWNFLATFPAARFIGLVADGLAVGWDGATARLELYRSEGYDAALWGPVVGRSHVFYGNMDNG